MLTYALAVFFLLITPGPGVLSTAGVGSAFGAREGARYVAGLFIGSNMVLLMVASGLAVIVFADPRVQIVLSIGSLCFLVYMALKIALAGSKLAFIAASKPPGVGGGVALQAINPKAYVVATTLFTGFDFWAGSDLVETVLKLVIMNAIWVPIHFLWLYAGIRIHALNLPERVQRKINIAMALSMLAVVGLALWAQR